MVKRKEKESDRLEKSGGTKDKVFVGGLDYQLTDDQFVAHFEEFGKVKEAQIVRDPVTNASRGFGFVTFINENVARRLITELQKCDLNGRMVDLRTAEPKLSEKIAIINKSFHEKSAGQPSGMNPSPSQNNNGATSNYTQNQNNMKPRENQDGSDKRKSRDSRDNFGSQKNNSSSGNGVGSSNSGNRDNRDRDRSKNTGNGSSHGNGSSKGQSMDQGRNRGNNNGRGMQQ